MSADRKANPLVEAQEFPELHFYKINELLIIYSVNLVEKNDQAGNTDLQRSAGLSGKVQGTSP